LKLGYGAALSLVLAVIVLSLTIVQAVLTRRARD
jgi:ABC-type sugar transport system permease subunit